MNILLSELILSHIGFVSQNCPSSRRLRHIRHRELALFCSKKSAAYSISGGQWRQLAGFGVRSQSGDDGVQGIEAP
jgi:hypothetical protein